MCEKIVNGDLTKFIFHYFVKKSTLKKQKTNYVDFKTSPLKINLMYYTKQGRL